LVLNEHGLQYSAPVRWVEVAKVSEIRPGHGRTVVVEGCPIALFNLDGVFHAIDDTCSHMGGPLGDGQLDGTHVLCPWHGARFEVTSGAVLSPPAGRSVCRYNTRVEGAAVLVEIEGAPCDSPKPSSER
jgi:nitrite reductase/ring-hydroxylating ferredoxin subunit